MAAASDIRAAIDAATKAAMRARERQRLKALRLVNAALKQAEIDGRDGRQELADADVLAVLTRMCKQRRDALGQFAAAGRDDLAAIEQYELDVIEEFMPARLGEAEIAQAVADAVAATGASSMKDMGRVMGALRRPLAGRADMGAVSGLVKKALAGG